MADKKADPSKPVGVVTPSGKVGYLPAAVADDAADAGVRKATDAELRTAQHEANKEAKTQALRDKFSGSLGAEVEGAVAPALAGAARGLSLGLSDEALVGLGGDAARQRLLDYQEYAPVTSALGEIGGIAGGALLGDEAGIGALPGAVSRLGIGAERGVAAALGEGAIARGAGVLARGAAEGAVFGAGNAVSESALKDTDLTGEALIGGAAHGALGGMVANGLLHGAGAAVGKGLGALRPPKATAGAYDAIAEREFGEAAPGLGRRLAEDTAAAERAGAPYRTGPLDEVGEGYLSARKRVAPEKANELGEIWKNREVALNDGAERLETHARDLSEAISKQQKAAAVTDMNTFGEAKINHMDKLVDRANFEGQAQHVMDWMFKAQDAVNTLAGDTAASKLGPIARREFESRMARLGSAMETGDSLKLFRAADDMKRFLGRGASFGKRARGLNEAERAFDDLYQGEGGLMSVLENSAWGKAADAQKAVNAAATQNISLGDRFRGKFTTEYGSTAGRPDFVANSEAVSGFMGRLTKAANDLDAQGVRDMIATRRRFLEATEKSYDHGAAAKTAIAEERSALDAMEKTFDKATKEASLINQVKRLQAEEREYGIGGALGLVTDTFSKPITTLRRLAMLEEHTQSVLGRMGKGTRQLVGKTETEAAQAGLRPPKGPGEGFFSQLFKSTKAAADSSGSVARAGGVKVEKYAQEARQISALQSNPQALSARIGDALGPMANAAPKTTAAATTTAMRGLAFLASKMPPSRQDPYSLQPQFQPTTRASDAEISQFQRYRQALDNPTSLPEWAAKGTLTHEHVEAVKAVYPKLYEQMRTQVFNDLVDSKSPVPYGRRIALGILLDLPTDQTLAPDFMQAIQATFTASEQAGQEPPPPNLAQLDVASSLESGAQRISSEGLDR
ncbi:hypothetical protein AKJ09_03661 [Labilithrix luteola]|uniref:Uncharacterized protein n=1 Tax=Labilithrix luteola TaxID=1391654 RepID=A0A0K1PU01_9BACT|nr:hypothetical protein [Labilithrix luteola]AKU96997.1 hypothetical protein AKJ09_03661 [Labilithrix luteola]